MVQQKLMANIRRQLLLQMEHLQIAADRTAGRIKGEAGNSADFMDQAAVEHDRAVELAIRERERKQILEIQETVLRIDHGQFGLCVRCGEAITPKRLLLAPMSRLCTSCKAKMEIHRNHRGRCIPPYTVSEDYAA